EKRRFNEKENEDSSQPLPLLKRNRKVCESLLELSTNSYADLVLSRFLRIYQGFNYYIDPKEMTESFGKFLLEDKFCLLYGPRKSGKAPRILVAFKYLLPNPWTQRSRWNLLLLPRICNNGRGKAVYESIVRTLKVLNEKQKNILGRALRYKHIWPLRPSIELSEKPTAQMVVGAEPLYPAHFTNEPSEYAFQAEFI
ncbi:5920_t:CDS:2, partial [Funneliformis caledonium]